MGGEILSEEREWGVVQGTWAGGEGRWHMRGPRRRVWGAPILLGLQPPRRDNDGTALSRSRRFEPGLAQRRGHEKSRCSGEDDASSRSPTCGDHAAVAVKRRDPCTKRRGDLRLSHLACLRAGAQLDGPPEGPEASVTGVHARQLGHGLRQKRGKGERKKRQRESKTASPSGPLWGREIAVWNGLAAGFRAGPVCQWRGTGG